MSSDDDGDIPPEFVNLKKSVLAKKLTDAKKAEKEALNKAKKADEMVKTIENEAQRMIEQLNEDLQDLEGENERLR